MKHMYKVAFCFFPPFTSWYWLSVRAFDIDLSPGFIPAMQDVNGFMLDRIWWTMTQTYCGGINFVVADGRI